jgi:competence protein CoiA
MRLAWMGGIRCDASPGLIGSCPGCSQLVIAKCGTQRIWHWAHQGKRSCDPWSEPETLWHRNWKAQFPQAWQEVIHRDHTGERHIADVKTELGLIIEFQHSSLPTPERIARERFYRNMVWVVDGTRLKRDRPRFVEGQKSFRRTQRKGLFVAARPEECFSSMWLHAAVPVLFDFDGNEASEAMSSMLWCLLPGRFEGQALVAAFKWATFLHAAQKRRQIITNRLIADAVADLQNARRIAQLMVQRQFYAPLPKWRSQLSRRHRLPRI